jgi:hypothetical protein
MHEREIFELAHDNYSMNDIVSLSTEIRSERHIEYTQRLQY